MKDFSQIEEGLLAGMEDTMQAGDDMVKRIKQAETIKKNLFLLNILWNKSGGSKYTQDFFGNEIKVGDVVLAMISPDLDYYSDWVYGIVVEEPNQYGDNCRIITCEAARSGNDPNDPYNDCVSYYVSSKTMFVLARQRKAKQMLQILESVN